MSMKLSQMEYVKSNQLVLSEQNKDAVLERLANMSSVPLQSETQSRAYMGYVEEYSIGVKYLTGSIINESSKMQVYYVDVEMLEIVLNPSGKTVVSVIERGDAIISIIPEIESKEKDGVWIYATFGSHMNGWVRKSDLKKADGFIGGDNEGSGQPAITKDWLRLYSSPTVSGTGRHVAKHPNANNYDWGMPEELLKYDSNNNPNPENYSTASMAAKMINAAGGSLIVKKENNNAYTDDERRYWIAVGPNFMNPNHTSNMQLKPEKMYYGTKIDIHVIGQHDGKDYYIPAVVGDAKEHSKPDGLYQTGVPFDTNRPTVSGDGSSVEFIGYGITTFIDANGNNKSTINYTNDYKLIELIVYDGNANY